MSELTRFLEEEGKRAKVEALKATSYEAICDILDDQERQLEEARKEKKRIMRWMKKYLDQPNGYKFIGYSDLDEMYYKLLNEDIEKQLKEQG